MFIAVRAATAVEIAQHIKGPALPITGDEGDWGIIDLPIGKDTNRKMGDLVSLRKMKVCFQRNENIVRAVLFARRPTECQVRE